MIIITYVCRLRERFRMPPMREDDGIFFSL